MTHTRIATLAVGLWTSGSLLGGCSHTSAQGSPTALPVAESTPSPLFQGCTREQPNGDNTVWKCGKRVVNFSAVAGVAPDTFMDQVVEGISTALKAKLQQTPIHLVVNGSEVAARQLSATSADGKPMMTSYLIARAVPGGKCELVHCLAIKSDPEALAACRPTIDYLLTKGPPAFPALVDAKVDLAGFLGHPQTLAADCQVSAGENESGGQVRCADRLTLRWDSIPAAADAPKMELLAKRLDDQFVAGGGTVKRDAPKCQIQKVEGTCARINVSQATGKYTFYLGSAPATGSTGSRLVLCGASDSDAASKALCEELFSFN